MTHIEKINAIMGKQETPEEAAVKSLLCKIQDDYDNETYEENSGGYLLWYHALLEWLKSEVKDESTINKETDAATPGRESNNTRPDDL